MWIFPREKGGESGALDGGRVVVGEEDALLHQGEEDALLHQGHRAVRPAVDEDEHQVRGRWE